MLIYLGRDPNSTLPEDYAAAEQALKTVRPYIKEFHAWNYVTALPRNQLCVSLGWSGDVAVARARAEEAKSGADIRFFTPQEGAMLWADNLAIPVDAPNPAAALAYINHMLDARVAADNAATTRYASPLSPELRAKGSPAAVLDNRSIYPDAETIAKLHGAAAASAELEALRIATWGRVTAAR
jgi:putrescine transport system substrate-binding protein